MKTPLILLLSLFSLFGSAQKSVGIRVPEYKDAYSDYVKKLEAGETAIDYKDFRYSFIESKQFKEAGKKSKEFQKLKEEMYKEMRNKHYDEIIRITQQMLSIDYTDMMAHKILRQTYKITGDSVNAAKYKTIQFGLLNSIVKNGDGKSCETAWPVIQISEEYFILEMIDARLEEQSVDNKGGLCDKMKVVKDGEKRTYYFEVSKVFESYKK